MHTRTRTHGNVYTPRAYTAVAVSLNVHDDCYTHIFYVQYICIIYLVHFYISGGSCGRNNVEERRPKDQKSEIPTDETGRRTT